MYVLYGTALNLEIEHLLEENEPLSVSEIAKKLKQKHSHTEVSEDNLRRRVRRALDEMEQFDKVEKGFIKKKSWFSIPVYKIKSNGN